MKTPTWEAITAHVTTKGYRAENIVAYGYYGSQANGLATQNSDEGIFIILDAPIPRKWKSNHSPESDCKLIYAKEWATQTDMLFDIIAIGNIVYPKMVRRPGGKPEYNPWAAYIRNHRPSVYVAAWAAVAAMTCRIGTYVYWGRRFFARCSGGVWRANFSFSFTLFLR